MITPTMDTSNPYRWRRTAEVLAALELYRWDLAEIETDLAADSQSWAHPGHTLAFLRWHVGEAVAELERRERLRDSRSAPAWPGAGRDRRAEAEAVKERLPIPTYLRLRGFDVIERGHRLTMRCPFPDHEDPNPSLSIKPDGRLWHCFGCQRGGDLFTLHMTLEGDDDFGRALDELMELSGLLGRARGTGT
jgi:CHC2-type zinc finger protein